MNASLYYPREMIINLVKQELEEVRKMFEIIFDENRDVGDRALLLYGQNAKNFEKIIFVDDKEQIIN